MKDLQDSIYHFNANDEANVIECLQDGTLNKKKYSDEEINRMRMNYSSWNKNYAKCIRKHIHPFPIIQQNLTSWFNTYKVQASPGKQQAGGRLDPSSEYSLFMHDTKNAVEKAKEKCEFITDPDIDTKYRMIKSSKHTKHNLPVYKSQGSESKMESFHPVLANFGNSSCTPQLSDSLGLAGTAQYNRSV